MLSPWRSIARHSRHSEQRGSLPLHVGTHTGMRAAGYRGVHT